MMLMGHVTGCKHADVCQSQSVSMHVSVVLGKHSATCSGTAFVEWLALFQSVPVDGLMADHRWHKAVAWHSKPAVAETAVNY